MRKDLYVLALSTGKVFVHDMQDTTFMQELTALQAPATVFEYDDVYKSLVYGNSS